MEPANLHPHHQLQEQFTGYYSSLLTQPAHKFSSTNDMNRVNINGNYNPFLSECIPNLREYSWPPVVRDSSMDSQSLSFCDATSFTQQPANQLLLANIKDEMADSFPKLSEMMYSPSNNVEQSHFQPAKYEQQYSHDFGENNWLGNFSSGHHITELQLSGGELYSNAQNSASDVESPSASCGHNFSQILPSINVSTSGLCCSLVSSSLDLNLQAVDLLTPTYGGANYSSQSSQSSLGRSMLELKDCPSNISNKTSASEDGFGRKKRPNSFPESKNFLSEAKKHRSTPQSPCPPLKVRKEKLGDRIAALQRLVAPYGKTDTASVLTEAIGYIQFLHDQVQTLSVPYMKSSNSNPTRTMQVSSSDEDGKGQPNRNLRSRGLCLVPLSCASIFSSYCNSGF